MKKFIFLVILLLVPIMVYAEDYDVKTLIPVDTKASVKTEKFDYNNFVYNSNGNGLITFEGIKNNYVTKSFVSINILLFGEDQKNIGFLTYCSDKDLDSNYADYELKGNSTAPFSIKVVSKYFVDGKGVKDVKYISVLDDNKYCQIGGYDKYKGLTLDEIVNGVNNNKNNSSIDKFIIELQEKGIMPIIIIGLVGFALLVVFIMIISSVVKKIKSNRINKISEVNVDVPMEETVDLTYDEVKDDSLDEDLSVSMGVVDNKEKEDIKDEEKDEDLTSFFN